MFVFFCEDEQILEMLRTFGVDCDVWVRQPEPPKSTATKSASKTPSPKDQRPTSEVSSKASLPPQPAVPKGQPPQTGVSSKASLPRQPAVPKGQPPQTGVSSKASLPAKPNPAPVMPALPKEKPPVPSPPIAASRAAIQSPVPPVVRPKTNTNVPTVLELQLRRMHLQQQSFGCISSILRFKPLEAGWFCFFSFDSHLRLSAIGLFLHGLFDFEGIERQPWRLRCSFLASLFASFFQLV